VHGRRSERRGLQRQRQRRHGRRAGRRPGRRADQRRVSVVRHRPVPMWPGLVAPALQQPVTDREREMSRKSAPKAEEDGDADYSAEPAESGTHDLTVLSPAV